jgi:hypothetical protein
MERVTTAQERCRSVAAAYGIESNQADDCESGSVGCPACPWRAGWSPDCLNGRGTVVMPTPYNTGAAQ